MKLPAIWDTSGKVDNNVYIYDLADTPHEGASSAFDLVLIEESNRGG